MEDKQNLKIHTAEENRPGDIRRPVSCCVVPSLNCNFRCTMCHLWKSGQEKDRLTPQEWVSFIDSLAGLLEGRKELTFSGGEPLLQKGILDLIGHGSKKGFTTVLCSNGFFIDETMARQIVDAGLKEIYLSLDSLQAHTHDLLRGMPGSYEKTMAAIRFLNRYRRDFKINIISVISRPTYTGIEELIKTLIHEGLIDGVHLQAIVSPFYAAAGIAWYQSEEYAHLWPEDPERVVEAIERLISLKRAGFPIVNPAGHLKKFQRYFENPLHYVTKASCYLGDYTMNINPAGEVLLCCAQPGLGNVRRDNIQELWFSSEADRERARMYQCERNCHNMVNCFFLPEKEGGT